MTAVDAGAKAIGVGLAGLSVGAVLAHGANGDGPLRLLPVIVLLLVGVLVSPASLVAELLGSAHSIVICLLTATAGQLVRTTLPGTGATCGVMVGIAAAMIQPLTLLTVRQWFGKQRVLAVGLAVAGFTAGALSIWPIGGSCGLAAVWWIGLSLFGSRWQRSGRRVAPLPFQRLEGWLMAAAFGSAALLLAISTSCLVSVLPDHAGSCRLGSGWPAWAGAAIAVLSVGVVLPFVLALPVRRAQTPQELVPVASLMFGLGHLVNGLSSQLLRALAGRFGPVSAGLALPVAASLLLLASCGLQRQGDEQKRSGA